MSRASRRSRQSRRCGGEIWARRAGRRCEGGTGSRRTSGTCAEGQGESAQHTAGRDSEQHAPAALRVSPGPRLGLGRRVALDELAVRLDPGRADRGCAVGRGTQGDWRGARARSGTQERGRTAGRGRSLGDGGRRRRRRRGGWRGEACRIGASFPELGHARGAGGAQRGGWDEEEQEDEATLAVAGGERSP